METYQLIIFSLLIGQWTISLPLYASFLSFGSFGSLLLRVLLLGRVYQFVAMPLGLTSSLSGFTSLVKEVRKLALRFGISVHMWLHIGSLEPIVVRGSFDNSLRIDYLLGVVLSRKYLHLFLQQVSFLVQVLNRSLGVPRRGKVFCLFSSSSFLHLRTLLLFLSKYAPLPLLAST